MSPSNPVRNSFGGCDLAVELVLGGRLVWYAETDPQANTVLAHYWPDVANLGDIRTVAWSIVAPVEGLGVARLLQDVNGCNGRDADQEWTQCILWRVAALW